MAELETVQVTQADREAAADYMKASGWCVSLEPIRDGKTTTPLVQAFARHRLAHAAPQPVGEDAEIIEYARWLIARLRATPMTKTTVVHARFSKDDVFALCRAFENTVTALLAENERMAEALRQIASCQTHHPGDVVAIARAALPPQPQAGEE